MRRAVVLVVVAAVVAGCAPQPGGTEPAGDVIAVAAAATTTEESALVRLDGSLALGGREVGTFTGDGELDFAGGASRMRVDASGLGIPASRIEIVQVGSEQYQRGLPGYPPETWIHVVGLPAVSPEQVTNGFNDPRGFVEGLAALGLEPSLVGSEVVDGVEVEHLRATTTFEELLRASIAEAQAADAQNAEALQAQLDAVAADTGGTATFDGWIDDHGLLRRIAMALDLRSGAVDLTMQFTLDLTAFGTPVSITAPPAQQTIDVPFDQLQTSLTDTIPEAPGVSSSTPAASPPATVAAEIVADQPTLPTGEAYEYIGVGTDETSFAAQWQRFGLSGPLPTLDFTTWVAFFVGFGESGSCPYEFGGVTVDEQRVAFTDAPFPPGERACTDDYNPRTLVVAVQRAALPSSAFTVDMPADAADVVASIDPMSPPPPASPNVVSASIDAIELAVEPQPVALGEPFDVAIVNRTDADSVATSPYVTIERWTGTHWETLGQLVGGSDVVEVGPGETAYLMTVATSDPLFAAGPGWYRVGATLDVTTGHHGRIDPRTNFEVRPA